MRNLLMTAILLFAACGDNIHPPQPDRPDWHDVTPGDDICCIGLPDDDVQPDAAVEPDASVPTPDADDCDDHDDTSCHWHHGHWHCDPSGHDHDGHWHQGHLEN